jgi:Fur family transcriptional regulator, zinc uptake regulator
VKEKLVVRTAKTRGDRDWIGQVEQICVQRGLQLTPTRRSVLEMLAGSRAPLGAYALIDQLSKSQGRTIAPPTVYRALEFLVEHGFVFRIASANAFAPCDHLGHHHHGLLLICSRCGRADEIESPTVDAALAETAARVGFRPQHQMVEIEGLCGACGETAAQPHRMDIL